MPGVYSRLFNNLRKSFHLLMLSPVSCPVEIVAKTIFPLGTTVLYVQFLGDF